VLAFHTTVCLLLVLWEVFVPVESFVQGQTKTKVILSPSSKKVRPSLSTAIDVQAVGFENLFAASVTLKFDSTILRYNDVNDGSFLTGNRANSVFLGVVPQPPLPAAPNQITVDQAIWGARTVSGSGILFTVIFTALRAGSSPLTIISYEFRNGVNEYIPAQTDSGNIIVNNPPTASQLLSPPDGSLIDTSLRALLVWSKSIDDDTSDNIRYTVCLVSSSSSMIFSDLFDTTLDVERNVLTENCEYSWYLDATDGKDTTSSKQTFKFKTPKIHHHEEFPCALQVYQNYPNPFNQVTNIRFSVPRATHVNVAVYDITGREIIRLMSNAVDAGYYTVTWDGKNSSGVLMGSGIYLCKVTAGIYSDVKKMVLMK
jgi:FlgD Ig-like domain/Cohesin domain